MRQVSDTVDVGVTCPYCGEVVEAYMWVELVDAPSGVQKLVPACDTSAVWKHWETNHFEGV